MKTSLIILASAFSHTGNLFGQQQNVIKPKKWGAEINVLWPIYPGNIYKGQVIYETSFLLSRISK